MDIQLIAKIFLFIFLLMAFGGLMLWAKKSDTNKTKVKFALYTYVGCLVYPVLIYALARLLVDWSVAGNIVGTPECSFSDYPKCFLAHYSIAVVFLLFMAIPVALYAWADALTLRFEPRQCKSIPGSVYYSEWLIERNWFVLPFAVISLAAIWIFG